MTEAPGGTVLLVDDEETIRSTAGRLLRRAGYRVLTATSAEEAEAVWAGEAGSIGILISDVELGGIDGATLAARFRQDRPGLPVVLTSGYSTEELRTAHPAPDGCRFLPKPFTAAELLDLVRALIQPSA